ncbi:MAG TPA: heavy metal-binding domain-containing protein [Chthonomonadaceae bacterium]|nr:heavy metal-binding domain-containing protein [Chthonomonadaceae bacterium]
MRLFGLNIGGEGESEEARLRREASERSLQQGGLPLNAVDRLREQAAKQGTPEHFFTSDLSVNELLLIGQAGYEPLGQVMGSSMYHVGWQYMPTGYYNWSSGSGELTVLTEAFYNARHLALNRLQQEAALIHATGVVGVRLEHKEYSWGAGMLEFQAIGTAIRERDLPPDHGAPPFLSDLSGEEFWMLRQAGFRPVGIAVGNCTYYCVPNWTTRSATTGGLFGNAWVNQELRDFTQSVYSARALAMGRMEHEARTVNAVGIVGADVEVDAQPREVEISENNRRIDMIYHFTAIGTAIAPYVGRWPLFKVQNAVTLE